ncbi:hypothetical protein ACJO2E_02355 [Marinobacter sp. M1N3S26]|uniref:hypothetical protein n=1 Tax=Marinobacter sp. M1N3S26 TaxID=3382299 RepID=UPI00387AB8F5
MIITAVMLQEMEQAIAPDAEAQVRIYPAGCDIRVSWNGGLSELNKNIAFQQIGDVNNISNERMQAAWQRLIRHFQDVKNRSPNSPE